MCNVFLPHEAELICGIALSVNLPEDKQVWAPTTSGLFSVRSAYKIAMEMRPGAQIGDVSDGSHLRKFWQAIWSCNIPHKIRHFAWRACRAVLPTKENLVRRKVLSDSCCEDVKWTKKHQAIYFGVVKELVIFVVYLLCFENHGSSTSGHLRICSGMR